MKENVNQLNNLLADTQCGESITKTGK